MTQFLQLLAADGPSNPVDPKLLPYITTIVVAGVSFFIMVKYVWPRIMQGLDDREMKILGEIESAENARAEAEKAKAEFEKALADARREAAEMVSKARADAKAAGDELRARNQQELGEMKRKAREEIEGMLGCKVYLELFVKVEKNWTKSRKGLRRVGFDEV